MEVTGLFNQGLAICTIIEGGSNLESQIFYTGVLSDKCQTGSQQIQHCLCPRSVFSSMIIHETQARTKTINLLSLLLNLINDFDDDTDYDLENNDAHINKKTFLS